MPPRSLESSPIPPFDAPLRAREALLQLIAKNCNDMLWSLHVVDGCFTFVSDSVERLLGLPPQEMSGLTLMDILHPDDRDRVRELLRDLPSLPDAKSSCVHIPYVRMRRADGSA